MIEAESVIMDDIKTYDSVAWLLSMQLNPSHLIDVFDSLIDHSVLQGEEDAS